MHPSRGRARWRTAIHHARVAEKKSFIFPMIYRRLLALHTTRRENVIARVRPTFRWEFSMLPRRPCPFQDGINHWLDMTFQTNHLSIYIRQLHRRQVANFRYGKKEKQCFQKRRNGNLLVEINTWVNELGSAVDQSRKIFMSHVQSIYTVCAELLRCFHTSVLFNKFWSRTVIHFLKIVTAHIKPRVAKVQIKQIYM